MKKVHSETINDIRMTGYFSSDTEVDSIRFEKTCYTLENEKTMAHRLELSLEKSNNEDVLYSVGMSISSTGYNEKKFKVMDVPKYKTFEYIDTKDMQRKEKKFLNKEVLSLLETWKNPMSSPYFRDFVNMHPSNIENPINISDAYANRLYYPTEDFEKFLYSFSSNKNSVLGGVKLAYINMKHNEKGG